MSTALANFKRTHGVATHRVAGDGANVEKP